jgi:hypothetical protein
MQQGLKPALILLAVSARLKSCPDTKPYRDEFFWSPWRPAAFAVCGFLGASRLEPLASMSDSA